MKLIIFEIENVEFYYLKIPMGFEGKCSEVMSEGKSHCKGQTSNRWGAEAARLDNTHLSKLSERNELLWRLKLGWGHILSAVT